jgi:hypothetical protein
MYLIGRQICSTYTQFRRLLAVILTDNNLLIADTFLLSIIIV